MAFEFAGLSGRHDHLGSPEVVRLLKSYFDLIFLVNKLQYEHIHEPFTQPSIKVKFTSPLETK